MVNIEKYLFLPICSGGINPCLNIWKPFGLDGESDLSDFNALRQDFSPPENRVKLRDFSQFA
jgi:hypothetical protein